MENQFHIKVNVGKYVCLVRIDSFCTNLISEYAVTQLGLKVENHPYPYKLNYCNEEFRVTKQVWVAISSGYFKDIVLCDVVPMDDCHICLGESWRYLNKAVYDPIRDIYRINSGRKLALSPLSKEQVGHYIGIVKSRVHNWLGTEVDERRLERASKKGVTGVVITDEVKLIDEEDTGEESAGNGEDPPSLVMGGDGINISMNLQVPKLTPLIVASDVAEVFRYSYVHLPTFHSLYHDALMGLSSMSNYCNCIFPVKCYGIFMGVHWSIVDGYLYWRSVLFVQGVIVEWLAIFARHDPRLPNIRCCVEPLHESSYSDIDVSGTIVNRYSNCVVEVGVNCLYGKCADRAEGWLFYVSHDYPLMERLYMEVLEDCVWDPRRLDEWKTFQFQFSYMIFLVLVECVTRSAHKEYWDWHALLNHSWQIENNLGDRGKFRVMRVRYFKHECERYTRVLRDHKHTCEELSFLYPSNLFLRIFVQRLKDLVFLSVHASDSRTNLSEE